MQRAVHRYRLMLLLASAALSAGPAWADTRTVTTVVLGTTAPWVVSAELNSAFPFGSGDGTPPVAVYPRIAGIDFSQGLSLTITCAVGATSAFGLHLNEPFTGPTGYLWELENNIIGPSGVPMPSYYFDPADYPAYMMELVGAFVDTKGQIVGLPFNIRAGRTVVIPAGAARLQLGVNDDVFGDNLGKLFVQVSGTAAPAQ